PDKLSPRDLEYRRQLLWYVYLIPFLRDRVGPEAADLVRDGVRANVQLVGPEVAVERDVEDCGVLSLVTRTRYRGVQGPLIGLLASWNAWMWAYGNGTYLWGLFLLAILVALLRGGLMFLTNYMAARATIEAATRLRRAIYHHTYRLGTLAFR